MNRWSALLCSVGLAFAGCESRVDPPPAPIYKPPGKTQNAAAPATTPTPSGPAAEPPASASVAEPTPAPGPKPPDPALLINLAEDLRLPDTKARLEAAARLSAYGATAAPAFPALMENLGAKDAETAKITSEVLVAIGTPAVPPLIELLNRSRQYGNVQAILTLKALGPKAAAAAPALIAGLGGRDPYTIRLRIQALVSIGKPAVPALIEELNRSPESPQEQGIQYQVRQDLAIIFTELGPEAAEASAALKAAAEKYPRSWEADAYYKLFGSITPVMKLAADLSDDNRNVRERAVEAIRKLGPAAKEALPALMEALKRQNAPNSIMHAIRAVGPAAVIPLIGVMESAQEEQVIGMAGLILEGFELPEEVAPRLAAMLLVPDGLRVESSIRLLEKMGPKAAAVIPTAAPLLKSPRDRTRQAVTRFLGRTKSPEAATVLAPFLKDSDLGTRIRTVEALKELGPAAKPAKDALRGVLQDEHQRIRILAQEILKQLEEQK